MVGVSPSSSCTAPCSFTRSATTSRGAAHSQLRSSQVWQKTMKLLRASSTRCASVSSGKHSADRKSTRLNSSHLVISYAVFCLKKKKDLHQHCRNPLQLR